MNKFLQKKISLDKLQQARNNRMLKIFLAIFIAGNTLFLTSGYIFPKMYKDLEVTVIGQAINMENYILNLDTWDYAKKDHAFEIILDIENLTMVENPDYAFRCMIGDEIKDGKIHMKSGSKLIVRFKDIPRRWADATLTVKAGDKEARLHMNDKAAHNVESLKERSEKEYMKYAVTRKIQGMEEYIKDLEAEKESLNDKMEKTYQKLTELNDKPGQSKEEQEIIDRNKSKLSMEMEEYKASQDECLANIEAVKEKIQLQEQLLKDIG